MSPHQPGKPVAGCDRARAAFAVSRLTAETPAVGEHPGGTVPLPVSVAQGVLDALAFAERDRAAEHAARLRLERHYADLLRTHARVRMDTDDDRSLHRRVVATFHRALRLYRHADQGIRRDA